MRGVKVWRSGLAEIDLQLTADPALTVDARTTLITLQLAKPCASP
jgi:hypothetical protein